MGCARHDRSAVARLHRPQRRLSGQRGRPPRRRGASPSARASTTARRRRGCRAIRGISRTTKLIHVDVDPRRTRPQLSARHRHPRRCAHLPAPDCWPSWTQRAPKRDGALKAWHADIEDMAVRSGTSSPRRTSRSTPRRSGPSASSRIARRCCREDAILVLRRRRQSQLVHAVLEGAPAADDAQFVGLLRHGLRRRRRARRQARRARPAVRGHRRRRLLHHGAARAVHGGRIQHPRGVGDLEQFRLGLDPRHPARHVRRPRARHHVPRRRQQDALQSRLRRLGHGQPASMP